MGQKGAENAEIQGEETKRARLKIEISVRPDILDNRQVLVDLVGWDYD